LLLIFFITIFLKKITHVGGQNCNRK